MKQRFYIIVGLVFLSLFGKSQNVLLNNWSIHQHQDTNIFLTVTAVDQFRHSNLSLGRWANGSLKNESRQVIASDIRNRELLRVSYSKPDFEIGLVTSQLSQHHKSIGGTEFNSLMSGIYPDNDTLSIQNLSAVFGSTITHSIEITKKSPKTILQLGINGSQINSLRRVTAKGVFVKNNFVYQGAYLSADAQYNEELSYLGSPEDVLSQSLNWTDSVRITSIANLPLLPSLNLHIVHRPTAFTEFHLRLEGLSLKSQLPMEYAQDSTSFKLYAGDIPYYDLFTEELPVILNNDDNYRRFASSIVDTSLLYRPIPLKIMGAYKVKIEPLTTIAFGFSYAQYAPYSLIVMNALIERDYSDQLWLQGGISTTVIGTTIQPNLSLGVKAKLAKKIILYGHTNALLSFPYINSTLVPSWSSRFQLNATLQYQLL